MKKLLSVMLAFALCIASAAAEGKNSSKTVADMIRVEATFDNPAGSDDGMPALEAAVADEFKAQRLVVDKAVKALAAAVSVSEHFGVVETFWGEETTAGELMETDRLDVHELFAFSVSGYRPECGYAHVTAAVPTPYQEGERLLVMVGIASEGEEGELAVQWMAYPTAAAAVGCVKLTLAPKTLLAIQESVGLIAVISVAKK